MMDEMQRQAYVVPMREGWGVVLYGFPPEDDGDGLGGLDVNDVVWALPLTSAVCYADAVAWFRETEIGGECAWVDGWPSSADLLACEPDLFARMVPRRSVA